MGRGRNRGQAADEWVATRALRARGCLAHFFTNRSTRCAGPSALGIELLSSAAAPGLSRHPAFGKKHPKTIFKFPSLMT